jgi:hypothetical protein
MNWMVRQKQTRSSSCNCTDSCNCKKTPMKFKGANSSNSKCWPGHAPKPSEPKTKMSPSGTGERVNNCS